MFLLKIIKNRELKNSILSTLLRVIPDKQYLKILYRLRMGKALNLDNPQTFNEKIQWLKLYDRRPEYTNLVDKYEVKKYVTDTIGEEHVIPTLGVWKYFDEIDFDALPDQFVLKCTHDSGGLVICRDKSRFDKETARRKIEKSLNCNFYRVGREWPYKNVKPRIIAEKYMEEVLDSGNNSEQKETGLKDYKFYCFNGKPQFLYLSQGLENHQTARINYVTLDWERAPFQRSDYKEFEQLPKQPKQLEKMILLSGILSSKIPFLRVDFYEINGQVYFGELTFSPGSGFTQFEPGEYDGKIGAWIKLPNKTEER